MGLSHIVRSQPRCHGLDALAFSGQKKPFAIQFQRFHAIGVLCGLRQAIEIGREALLLCAWRRNIGAHADTVQGERMQSLLIFPGNVPYFMWSREQAQLL